MGTATRFHPLPFAHFLGFLCYYRLHDSTSSSHFFQQLLHAYRTITKCGTEIMYPICLNTSTMCGICYQFMGYTNSAIKTFQEAAERDYDNLTSASLRLSSLTS